MLSLSVSFVLANNYHHLVMLSHYLQCHWTSPVSDVPVGVGHRELSGLLFVLSSKHNPLYRAKYVADVKKYLLNKYVDGLMILSSFLGNIRRLCGQSQFLLFSVN